MTRSWPASGPGCSLPGETVVHTGHGASSTIAVERAALDGSSSPPA